jgi:hypothetical protein
VAGRDGLGTQGRVHARDRIRQPADQLDQFIPVQLAKIGLDGVGVICTAHRSPRHRKHPPHHGSKRTRREPAVRRPHAKSNTSGKAMTTVQAQMAYTIM